MYVSRLTFHTTPGKTHEVEQELLKLMAMVSRAGGGGRAGHAESCCWQ
jgi:hypothetical protein